MHCCTQDPFSAKQVYIMGVSLLTVGLWCFNSKLQVYTGEMGVIAILPLVAFFGFGILNKVLDASCHQVLSLPLVPLHGFSILKKVLASSTGCAPVF